MSLTPLTPDELRAVLSGATPPGVSAPKYSAEWWKLFNAAMRAARKG